MIETTWVELLLTGWLAAMFVFSIGCCLLNYQNLPREPAMMARKVYQPRWRFPVHRPFRKAAVTAFTAYSRCGDSATQIGRFEIPKVRL
jgi:hypothetical protein